MGVSSLVMIVFNLVGFALIGLIETYERCKAEREQEDS